MQVVTVPWINAVAGTVEGIAITLLLLVNGAFALRLVLRRDHRFVDRWTGPLLAANAALLVAAVGAPAVALAAKLVAKGVALTLSTVSQLAPTR